MSFSHHSSSSVRQPIILTPYLTEQIGTSLALARQFVPSPAEAITAPEEFIDPIGDITHTPVKGIVHRYPDRVLLMPHFTCAAYCRFCFRRERVGQSGEALSPVELINALAYIRACPAIWEVILTGGDPLMLASEQLQGLLMALADIPHLGVIRLHTRLPISDPQRVSVRMIAALTTTEMVPDDMSNSQPLNNKALYVVLHCNHVDELGSETTAACRAIVRAGVPMLAQTVLLKGVNDTPAALAALFRALVRRRIKPYYLHHGDLARGTGHFRTTLAAGQALMRALRGELSGLCQPTYVLDIPGGHGKVPVGPCYMQEDPAGMVEVEDPGGRWHSYPPQVL